MAEGRTEHRSTGRRPCRLEVDDEVRPDESNLGGGSATIPGSAHRAIDGASGLAGEHGSSVATRAPQPRRSGRGRRDDCGVRDDGTSNMGRREDHAARRTVRAEPSSACVDPEADGRRASAWHSDGAGPADSTGASASSDADVRPGILGVELRLSSRPFGPRGCEASEGVRDRRAPVRGGSGSREVLRSRSARRADAARGSPGSRPSRPTV